MENATVRKVIDNVQSYSAGGDVLEAELFVLDGGIKKPVRTVTIQNNGTKPEFLIELQPETASA